MKYYKLNKKNRNLPKIVIQETVCLRKLIMPRKILWKVNKPNKYCIGTEFNKKENSL